MQRYEHWIGFGLFIIGAVIIYGRSYMPPQVFEIAKNAMACVVIATAAVLILRRNWKMWFGDKDQR
jgi:Ca2+/Na+ antiporter